MPLSQVSVPMNPWGVVSSSLVGTSTCGKNTLLNSGPLIVSKAYSRINAIAKVSYQSFLDRVSVLLEL
jgi:hypothetical protein